MDDLLPKLLSFPPHPPPPKPISDHQYDEGIKEQIETCKKMSDSKLLQQTSGGEQVLDVINPALNTIPYAFVLLANINALEKGNKAVNPETIWAKLTGFLSSFDPRQIRYLGDQLSKIIGAVEGIARSSRQLHLAVAPIRDALLRLDPSGAMLTTSHLYLVKMALESEAYADIVPLLEKPILYFPTSSQNKPKFPCDLSHSPATYICKQLNLTGMLKYYDILEYFLYSGIVFMGLGRWEEASECLESAVTFPAKDGSVSKIMVEAYKKWVLVGLLTQGTLRSLPNTTSSGASKAYHVLGKPYESLAQIFENGSASRLKSEAEFGQTIWLKDANLGLVMHILAAYQKWQIRNLAKVYSKISIQEVHNQTTSAETGAKLPSQQATETLVQAMIQNGELHATLDTVTNQPVSVLAFSPGGPALSEAQVQKELAASTLRIHTLTKEIKETDKKLTHDKEYVNFLKKQKKHAKNGTAMDLTLAPHEMDWHDPIEDEDIMSPY